MSDPSTQSGPLKRAKKATFVTLVVYALLVATHLGEFWPFSIYPMFSQGGRTWVRSVVRDVSAEEAVSWQTVGLDELPGKTFPMAPTGVNQNDVANFVSKSADWGPNRVGAMRALFGPNLQESSLQVFRVEGRLTPERQVEVRYEPFILMTPDTTLFGPRILETGGAR